MRKVNRKYNINTKIWKSSKVWLYSSGILVGAIISTGISEPVNYNSFKIATTVSASTMDSSHIIYGTPDNIDTKQEEEDSSFLSNQSQGILHSKMLRSALVVNTAKNSVTRTSDGFTENNPSSGVKSVSVNWEKNTDEIGITVSNAFYINTPLSFSVELESPLSKGESIEIPIHMTGKIFNSNSSAELSTFRTSPYVGQNNGNYYEAPDHSFSYDYSESTGMLTIKALTEANNTKFENMSYFMISNGSPWVPVPLNNTPFPLEGGVAGNYGQKGSGGTLTVSVGSQTTSETITNLVDTQFTDKLESQSSDIVNSSDSTITSKARSSNNFLSSFGQSINQTNVSGTNSLLDGSVDHYSISATKNAELTELAKKDPFRAIRFEAYTPLGSNKVSKSNVAAIFAGSNASDFPAFQNIFKNAKYDESTKTVDFDVSRDPKDWANLAIALLATPKGSQYYDRIHIPYVQSYLEAMASDNDSVGDTFQMTFYLVSPNTGFEPINFNNDEVVTGVITNSKSKKSVKKVLVITPVVSGQASSTQTSIAVQTVDNENGKSIGDGATFNNLLVGEKWNFTPPTVKGYAYVSTNDKTLLSKLGIEGLATSGTVTQDMIGKSENILFAYTNKGTITSHFVDEEGKELHDKSITTDTDGNIPQIKAPIISNYELKSSPTIPSVKAGENIDITYIYSNKSPISYSVIDDTAKVTLVDSELFANGIIGNSMMTSGNQSKLNDIKNNYISKGYILGKVENGDLPAPKNSKGYLITIHLTHGTKQQDVPGPKAASPIQDKVISQTVHYIGAGAQTPKDDVQQFTFTSTVTQTIDLVNGDVIKEQAPKWSNPQTSKEVVSPKITGFKAETTKIPAKTYQVTDTSQILNVTYTDIKSPILYSVVDDTIGTTLENSKPFNTAILGQDENTEVNRTKLSTIEKGYTDKGYKLGKVENGDLPNPTDIKGYLIKIHLTHGTKKQEVPGSNAVTPILDKVVTQTIHYIGAGPQTPQDDIQKFTFTSTVTQTIDLVTGKVVKENAPEWSSPQKSKEVPSPKIPGYRSDYSKVDSQSYNSEAKSKVIQVSYEAEVAKITVNYRDIDSLATEADKVVSTQELVGHTDSNFDNTSAYTKVLKELKNKGYILVGADAQKGKYPVGNTILWVDLKHEVKPTENYQEKDVSQSISYLNLKGDQVATSNNQVFHFTNGASIDQVTGKVVKDNWSKDQNSKEIESPALEGYRPDIDKVQSKTYSPTSEDEAVKVIYSPTAQKRLVQFIDVNGLKEVNYNQGVNIKDAELSFEGVSDAPYNNEKDVDKNIQQLHKQGYELVKMDEAVKTGFYDHKEGQAQVSKVYLKHSVKTIKGGLLNSDGSKNPDYYHEASLKVHYEGAGEKTPPDQVQTFEFVASVTYDQVTNKVNDSVWPKPEESKEVEIPVLKNYKASQTKVQSLAFDEKSSDKIIIIRYETTKDKKILPNTGLKPSILKCLSGVSLLFSSIIVYLKFLRKQ